MLRARRHSVVIGIVDQGTDKVAHYVRDVEAAGARAEVIDWRVPRDAAADIARYDGFVLCGGDDIHARHFGESNHPSVVLEDERREAYEIAFCRAALVAAAPLLAVCRGVQILNVALGGGLEQHVPDVPGRGPHADGVRHALRLQAGSRLAVLAGGATRRPTVNSYHHQAAGSPAAALRVTAWSDDGVVEAMEGPGRFCVGVQWHPEREGNDEPLGAPLFAALVAAARS